MIDARIIGEARLYDDMVELYRARMAALGLTFETVDYVSGLQAGYTAKLLGPAQEKRIGPLAMQLLNRALAVKIVLVEDAEAAIEMQPRWDRRERPLPSLLARASSKALARFKPIVVREINRSIAAAGGKARAAKLSKRRRQSIARKGGKARWRTPQIVEITTDETATANKAPPSGSGNSRRA